MARRGCGDASRAARPEQVACEAPAAPIRKRTVNCHNTLSQAAGRAVLHSLQLMNDLSVGGLKR